MIIDHENKEINLRIIYFGLPLSGKTMSISYINNCLSKQIKQPLINKETKTDRLLYFTFTPSDFMTNNGYKIQVGLYTNPGAIIYHSTSRLLLKGVDGIIFVADIQNERMEDNIKKLDNLLEILKDQNIDINECPFVFQYNKIDLPNKPSLDSIQKLLNKIEKPFYQTIAYKGINVLESLQVVVKLLVNKLEKMGYTFNVEEPDWNSMIEINKGIPKEFNIIKYIHQWFNELLKRNKKL